MNMCIFIECRNVAEAGSTKCSFHRHRLQCKIPDCRNQSYARGRCVRHGARKRCDLEGCNNYRRVGGYCARHTTALRKNLPLVPGQEFESHLYEPLSYNPHDGHLNIVHAIDWHIVSELLNDHVDTSIKQSSEVDWNEVFHIFNGSAMEVHAASSTLVCI